MRFAGRYCRWKMIMFLSKRTAKDLKEVLRTGTQCRRHDRSYVMIWI